AICNGRVDSNLIPVEYGISFCRTGPEQQSREQDAKTLSPFVCAAIRSLHIASLSRSLPVSGVQDSCGRGLGSPYRGACRRVKHCVALSRAAASVYDSRPETVVEFTQFLPGVVP